MLKVGETSTIKFNVDVNGSGTPPEVRVVINVGDHELGFKCNKVGDEWQADVKIPADTEPGMYDMRVEVSINNRLFTPVKRQVEIGREIEVSVIETPVAPPVSTPAEPTPVFVAPVPEEKTEPVVEPVEPTPEEKKPEPVAAKPAPVEKPKPVVKKTTESLIKQITPEAKAPFVKAVPAAKPAPVNVAPVKTKKVETVIKKQPPLVLPKQPELKGEIKLAKRVAPRPVTVQPVKEAAPLRISMKDVSADASTRFDSDLRESYSYQKPTVEVRAFTMSPAIPVRLIKGEIVYE